MGFEMHSPPQTVRPGQQVSIPFAAQIQTFAWGIWAFNLTYGDDRNYDILQYGFEISSQLQDAHTVVATFDMTLQDASHHVISNDSGIYPVCIGLTGPPDPKSALATLSRISSNASELVTVPASATIASAFPSGLSVAFDEDNHPILETTVGVSFDPYGQDQRTVTPTATLLDNKGNSTARGTMDVGYLVTADSTPPISLLPVTRQTQSPFDVEMPGITSISEVVMVIQGWNLQYDKPRHVQSISVQTGVATVRPGTNIVTVPQLYASMLDGHGNSQDDTVSYATALIVAIP